MGHLRRGPECQLSLKELGNGHVGFQGNMLRRRRAEDILENKISLAKPLFDIAVTQLEMTAEVAPRRKILNQFAEHRLLLRPRIVDQRRGGLEGPLFIKHSTPAFLIR